MVNMNPKSRLYVERGHSCLRENQSGVDLNRNYDIKWSHVVDHYNQISSGDGPFSETETQIVRDVLAELRPEVFVSVHSGTLAVLHPYAYEMKQCGDSRVREVAQQVAREFCQHCSVGGAAHSIGYTASGSSQDYSYDVSAVTYAFTYEIFGFNKRRSLIHKNLKHNSHLKIKRLREPNSNYGLFLSVRD